MNFGDPDNLEKAIAAQKLLNECFVTYANTESYKTAFGHNTPVILDVIKNDFDTVKSIWEKAAFLLDDLLDALEHKGRVLKPYEAADTALFRVLMDEKAANGRIKIRNTM